MAKPKSTGFNFEGSARWDVMFREAPGFPDLMAAHSHIFSLYADGKLTPAVTSLAYLHALIKCLHEEGVTADFWNNRANQASDVEVLRIPRPVLEYLASAFEAYLDGAAGTTLDETFGAKGRVERGDTVREMLRHDRRRYSYAFEVFKERIHAEGNGRAISIQKAAENVAEAFAEKGDAVSPDTIEDAWKSHGKLVEKTARNLGLLK